MKVLKLGCTLIAMAPMLLILYFLVMLAWIAWWPVPRAPRFDTGYSVMEVTTAEDIKIDPYTSDPLRYGWRLTDDGRIVQLDETTRARDNAARKEASTRLARQLGLAQNPYGDRVIAVASNGHAMVIRNRSLRLWRDGQFTAAKPQGVRGYRWEIYDVRFHKLNARDEAIGNGRIATAFASSGGTSSPHGRLMPLQWRGDNQQPEDLNSLIDASSGWYLDQAVDINERGQVLCAARRTDEKGAEQYGDDERWVILTPQK